MILALDLGQECGYAMEVDGNIISGTAQFKPGRFEGGGMPLVRMRRWLDELSPDEVWVEEVRRHRRKGQKSDNVNAAQVFGAFLGVVTSWCEERNVPYGGIPVGTIKKHLAGVGNAGKPAMMAAIKDRGYDPKDDNEADAIAILLTAKELFID